MIHQRTITLAPKLTIHAIGEELVGALESIGEVPALVALVALLVELDVAGCGPAGNLPITNLCFVPSLNFYI